MTEPPVSIARFSNELAATPGADASGSITKNVVLDFLAESMTLLKFNESDTTVGDGPPPQVGEIVATGFLT